MINYKIKDYTYMGRVGSRVGSGQTFCQQLRVGSGQRLAGSGRVQEKWPVDNSELDRKTCMGFRMVKIFLTSGDL